MTWFFRDCGKTMSRRENRGFGLENVVGAASAPVAQGIRASGFEPEGREFYAALTKAGAWCAPGFVRMRSSECSATLLTMLSTSVDGEGNLPCWRDSNSMQWRQSACSSGDQSIWLRTERVEEFYAALTKAARGVRPVSFRDADPRSARRRFSMLSTSVDGEGNLPCWRDSNSMQWRQSACSSGDQSIWLRTRGSGVLRSPYESGRVVCARFR